MSDYERLEAEAKKTARVADHRGAWERLTPLLSADAAVRDRVDVFARSKQVSLEALVELNTRVRVDRHGGVELAWAHMHRNGVGEIVSAVKYRPLDPIKKRYAEPRSSFLTPLVLGRRDALDWFLAEGETDAARLFDLVGDVAAVLVLPAGALTFKPSWADVIPRGATVYCCHDADEKGDQGAAKAAKLIGGRTVRVRPPLEGGDWCDFQGDRAEFAQFVSQARAGGETLLDVLTARELCALPDPPESEQLLGPLLIRGQRLVLGAHTGEGKTTLSLQLVRAVVTGGEFLDWQGVGGRVLVLDAEQGLRTVKRRLREAGLDERDDVDYIRVPDGLALDSDPAHVVEVERVLEQGGYALVIADPLYKLHTGDSNDEREAVDLMRRFDGWRERYGFALLLPVHCRKPVPGMKFSIHDLFGSSAYVRGAEVVLGMRRVSDGYAKLHFLKDREGDLPIGAAWGLLFDQEQGFRRDPADGVTRDLRVELLEHLDGGDWHVMTRMRQPREKGGVGADPGSLQPVLDELVAERLLEFQVGPEGQRRNAKCWRIAKRREGVDEGDDGTPDFASRSEAESRSVVPSSPIEETEGDDASTDTEPDDDKRREGDDASLLEPAVEAGGLEEILAAIQAARVRGEFGDVE